MLKRLSSLQRSETIWLQRVHFAPLERGSWARQCFYKHFAALRPGARKCSRDDCYNRTIIAGHSYQTGDRKTRRAIMIQRRNAAIALLIFCLLVPSATFARGTTLATRTAPVQKPSTTPAATD